MGQHVLHTVSKTRCRLCRFRSYYIHWFLDGNGKWYWMNNDGAMVANTSVNVDGVNYRFDKDGAWVA